MEFILNFKRYETKYLLSQQQYTDFLNAAGSLIEPDIYGLHTICNIYLDTDDYYLAERSLERPCYKEKLRMRSYGNVKNDDSVFLEIKKKYCGVVYKRRINIPFSEAENYVYNGVVPQAISGFANIQIYNEIDWLMKKYVLTPKLYIAYDRTAFISKYFSDVRVTFDRNIRSRANMLTLRSDGNTHLLDTGIENYVLMELKTGSAVPLKLAKILSELQIYPTSFSKYGRIYTEMHTKKDNTSSENSECAVYMP